MKIKFLVCVVFICFTTFIFSQKKEKIEINNRYNEIKKTPSSKKKVDALIQLYRTSVKQRETNELIINTSLSISEELFYITGIAKSYNRKGLSARYQGNYDESVRLHKRALSYFNKSTDSLSKLKCLNNLGVSYRKMNQDDLAFQYYFQALELAKKINSQKSIAIANNGIGHIFIKIGDSNQAIEYFKKAIQIEVEYNNDRNQEIGFSNISEAFILKKEYDSAQYYLSQSKKIALRNKNYEGLAIKNNISGNLHQKKGAYRKAIMFYDKAIPDLKTFRSKNYLCNTYINKGICLVALQNKNAINSINKGLNLAKNINSTENISLGYQALVDYYTKKNDFKAAMKFQNKIVVLSDSILKTEAQKNIYNTKISLKSFNKDQEIQKLAEEKAQNVIDAKSKFNLLLFVFILAVIGIFGLLYMIFLKKKNTDLELDNQRNEIQNYLLQINELKEVTESQKSNHLFHLDSFNLSRREIEVFNFITKGLSNIEIASELFLSKNTIKTHIKNIYLKLDVKNRKQAIHKISIHKST